MYIFIKLAPALTVCPPPQGAWGMEGEMLKGQFTRKDNNKVLTTTRTLVGEELVQVSVSSLVCHQHDLTSWGQKRLVDRVDHCQRGFGRSYRAALLKDSPPRRAGPV